MNKDVKTINPRNFFEQRASLMARADAEPVRLYPDPGPDILSREEEKFYAASRSGEFTKLAWHMSQVDIPCQRR